MFEQKEIKGSSRECCIVGSAWASVGYRTGSTLYCGSMSLKSLSDPCVFNLRTPSGTHPVALIRTEPFVPQPGREVSKNRGSHHRHRDATARSSRKAPIA